MICFRPLKSPFSHIHIHSFILFDIIKEQKSRYFVASCPIDVFEPIVLQNISCLQLIPNDTLRTVHKKVEVYVGVVHCRVWRAGRWVDIFVDDSVPSVANSGGIRLLSYCHDKDELWLTFIEKAWARYGWWDLPVWKYTNHTCI